MIRHFLSRNVLKSLLKKGGFFDIETLRNVNDRIKDINLEKVKAIFGSSNDGGGSEIPPVEFNTDESLKKPQADGKKKSAGLTDAEIEDAIGLLFEYFEDTFALLKGTLNDKCMCLFVEVAGLCSLLSLKHSPLLWARSGRRSSRLLKA